MYSYEHDYIFRKSCAKDVYNKIVTMSIKVGITNSGILQGATYPTHMAHEDKKSLQILIVFIWFFIYFFSKYNIYDNSVFSIQLID